MNGESELDNNEHQAVKMEVNTTGKYWCKVGEDLPQFHFDVEILSYSLLQP